ncbi:nicotinamidase-like amidase [Sistotremastrum niveocremeum HHB9708]|uniref:Nicotinamidase-like amidase n=1 Tax=Sistotremastrum niveocremeum HHB9708 TaxID=1314777 RepID=A0A164UXN2_9AGAM|nr:nicotinamidase-like amidase [Sistotremastrum niveocremeum HHB9708]
MSTYPLNKTAVILMDPYNDFLLPGGKVYPRLEASLQSVGLLPRLHKLVASVRELKIPIFYAMHRQYREGDWKDFQNPTAMNLQIVATKTFEKGSWGAKFVEGLEPDIGAGDVVVTQHWNSSGFANTNLDLELRQHGITRVALAGLVSNTCLETTGRYAVELGYHTTMLKDCTAGFTQEQLDVAINIAYPLFAHAVLTLEEWLDEVKKAA